MSNETIQLSELRPQIRKILEHLTRIEGFLQGVKAPPTITNGLTLAQLYLHELGEPPKPPSPEKLKLVKKGGA
jgi:hypothetical protein